MRYLLVAVLGFALVTTGLFFAWGDKTVTRADCTSVFLQPEVRSSTSCDITQVDALYWADHLTIDIYKWKTTDGEAGAKPSWEREFHDYDPDGDKFDGNQGLFWGRPVTWFGIGLAGLAFAGVVATWQRRDVWRHAALWSLVGGAGFVALGTLLGMGGMAVHSASWSGTTVERLTPHVGGYLVTAGMGFALFGTLRFQTYEVLRLRGVLGQSPLAAIFSWDEPAAAEPAAARQRVRLHWGAGTWLVLAALLLAAPLPFVTFAHKDITLMACQQDSATGWTCEGYDHDVAYRLSRADIDVRDPAGEGAAMTLAYDGAFQDRFGGSRWLAWSDQLAVAAALVVAAAGTQQLLRDAVGARRVVWTASAGAAGFAVLTFVATWPILNQSMQWAGSPAGHLRPGLGAWLAGGAAMAMVAAAVVATRQRHAPPQVDDART